MDYLITYLDLLPNVLEQLERYPFGALVLLGAGWLGVQALRAKHGARKPDTPPKS